MNGLKQYWLHLVALRISKQLPSCWPLITRAWPLTPAMCYTLVRGSCYQIWWPLGIYNQFDLSLTLADPYMTFDPSNAFYSGQGFFLPNLVAIGHLHEPSNALWSGVPCTKFGSHRECLCNLTSVDPGWPLHDLWPQQCIILWSGIRSTRCVSHRAFLGNLISG